MTRGTPADKHREGLERLAFGLAIHGVTAADRTTIRWLANGPLWLELRHLLLQYGFSQAEVATLMGRHPTGCPCWTCVLGLNRWVRKTRYKLERKVMPMRKAEEALEEGPDPEEEAISSRGPASPKKKAGPRRRRPMV